MKSPIEAAVRDAMEDYKLMRKSTQEGAQISPREYAARTQKLTALVAHNPSAVRHIYKKDQALNLGSAGVALGSIAGYALSKGKMAPTFTAMATGGAVGAGAGTLAGDVKAKKMLLDTNTMYHTPGAVDQLIAQTYKRDMKHFEAQKQSILRNALK